MGGSAGLNDVIVRARREQQLVDGGGSSSLSSMGSFELEEEDSDDGDVEYDDCGIGPSMQGVGAGSGSGANNNNNKLPLYTQAIVFGGNCCREDGVRKEYSLYDNQPHYNRSNL